MTDQSQPIDKLRAAIFKLLDSVEIPFQEGDFTHLSVRQANKLTDQILKLVEAEIVEARIEEIERIIPESYIAHQYQDGWTKDGARAKYVEYGELRVDLLQARLKTLKSTLKR